MSTTEDSRDVALVELLAEDLETAFVKIFHVYNEQLVAFALKKTGCRQSAEDIVQESWTNAYVALDNYSKERRRSLKLRSWLYKIVDNKCKGHGARIQKIQFISVDKLRDEGFEFGEDASSDDIHRVRVAYEISTAIQKLPASYQTILTAYFLEDLSYQEIADRLHKQVKTIRKSVERGLKMLKEELGKPTHIS